MPYVDSADLAGTGTGQGAALVGFKQAGTGAVASTVLAKAREVVSVLDFGATGDGSTDDYAAFAAALAKVSAAGGGAVLVPHPATAYNIGSQITLPSNCGLIGEAPQATRINHAFNGNLFVMGEGSFLGDLYLHGDGSNYAGRAMDYQDSAGRQLVWGVRATNWDGEVQYYETDAGSQSAVYNCRFARSDAGTGTGRYAVVIDPAQQLSARPRKFSMIETDGTCSFDFGGSNDTFVQNSFIGDVAYNAESRGVQIVGSRIANQTALTLRGHNNTIVGSDIAPQITIASGTDNCAVQGNSYNSLPVIDSSGNSRNLVDAWQQSYTPTLTSGGTAPSLGNGTILGFASRTGNMTHVFIILTIGSTTALGTGDLRVSLPIWAPNSNGFVQVCGQAQMTGGSTNYIGVVQIPNNVNYARIFRDTTGVVTYNDPATWASGDTFRLGFSYMV